jgi:hypothetical protein
MPALADLGTAYVDHTSVGPGVSMTIWGRTYQGLGGVLTGQYNHIVTNSTTSFPIPGWGFCIEMQGSTTANVLYNVLDLEAAPINQGPGGLPMGITKADYIRELWALHIGDATTNNGAAAFQAAVWEIVYEDKLAWNVKTHDTTDTMNSFKIDGNDTVEALANTWLGQLDGSGPLAYLGALSNASYQDYVVQIPAPGAVVLGVLGLGLIGWVRRRIA